jgi:hypothetical protein
MNNYMSLSPLSITHTMRNSKSKILLKHPHAGFKTPKQTPHPPDMVYISNHCHRTCILILKTPSLSVFC